MNPLNRLLLSFALLFLLASCAVPAAIPDAPATESAIAAKIFATLTAAAPSMTVARTMTPPLQPPSPARPALTLVPPPTPVSTPTVPPTATPTAQPTDPPAPIQTASPETTLATVTGASVNLRAGPGTTHPIVGSLRRGDSVSVLGKDERGLWLQVRLAGGSIAWIASSLVTLSLPATSVAVAEHIPTAPAPPPTPTIPAPAPVAKPPVIRETRELEVVFTNLHYECEKTEWVSRVRVWGYRSFQADMFIRNGSARSVDAPWKPKRWIITDGSRDRTSDLIWEWGHVQTGLFNQSAIGPGQTTGWTFMAFPIDRNEWVKAAEFEWQGQLYRVEFSLGPLGNDHNYRDCGDYPPVTGPREPVPVDTSTTGATGQTPPTPSR